MFAAVDYNPSLPDCIKRRVDVLVRQKKVNQDLIFQAISWIGEDVLIDDEDEEDVAHENQEDHVIKCFGVKDDGTTVSVSIKNFHPYFYVKVDDNWTKKETSLLHDSLKRLLHRSAQNNILSVELCKKKDFWGFTNFKMFNFAKITFKNLKTMRSINYKLTDQNGISIDNVGRRTFRVYESNIDPFIRFIHTKDLDPVGWISIPARRYKCTDVLPSTCQLDVEVDWNNVHRHDSLENAPFLVASFDIECMSRSGDFPLPHKDYGKLARQVYDMYVQNIPKELLEYKKREILLNAFYYALGLELVPTETPFMYKSRINIIDFKSPIQDTEGVRECFKVILDDIVTILNGKSPSFAKFRVQNPDADKNKRTYIIEELTNKLDNMGLPDIMGDSIIQIGTTFHVYGDRQCCFRHILCLGDTTPIDNAYVQSCGSETEMLLEWRNMIQHINPDVITGYNITGFDFTYMYERVCDLGIQGEFMNIGRLRDTPSKFKVTELSSSALGDNTLKYIDMQGRVLVDMMKVIQRDHKLDTYKLDHVASLFMGMKKDDVSPQDIFRLQDGTSDDRKRIAEYCLKDCELCNRLMSKLEILANNIGMANVCKVPLSFIFMRGQGIKILSLVMKQCMEDGFLIPVIKKSGNFNGDEDSYEGAIVLDPKEGIYTTHPVSVLDFYALYPSAMCSEEISHERLLAKNDQTYKNLDGVAYVDIKYDIFVGKGDKKVKVGEETSTYAQLPNGEKGVIPRILMKLLSARKATRNRLMNKLVTLKNGNVLVGHYDDTKHVVKMENGDVIQVRDDEVSSIQDEYNDFQKAVLDGLQLAYKITANSLYGQMGAKTSPLYLKEIAACTTATGRSMILKAKEFLEQNYGANVIYGDTDSIFVIFKNVSASGTPLTGRDAIMNSIRLAKEASRKFKQFIKEPHDLEYEKTYWPFILLSKKRYAGHLYGMDDVKYKQHCMGIALKRRDNAPIVKEIYGGVIDIILKTQDVNESITFLQQSLKKLINGKYPLKDFIITKSLSAHYKNPHTIAHKVLADRMAERNPGDKPQTNDRIPFVYFVAPPPLKGRNMLQGDMIEHPDYVVEKKLKVDYASYITKQIMNPVVEIYSIVVDRIPGNTMTSADYDKVYKSLEQDDKYKGNVSVIKDAFAKVRKEHVQRILFDPILKELERIRIKNSAQNITRYFKPLKDSDKS